MRKLQVSFHYPNNFFYKIYSKFLMCQFLYRKVTVLNAVTMLKNKYFLFYHWVIYINGCILERWSAYLLPISAMVWMWHKVNFLSRVKLVWIQSFPSPRLAAISKLKNSVFLSIYPQVEDVFCISHLWKLYISKLAHHRSKWKIPCIQATSLYGDSGVGVQRYVRHRRLF